jgi:uncharacterized membrane protein YcgQ (UPF0703/DUF1980 family)
MVKNIFIIALFLGFLSFISLPTQKIETQNTTIQTEPDTITWKLLGVINYKKKPHKDFPEGVLFPKVNATLKMLSGKKVVLTGFIVPIDNTSYALSKTVFASCFFCGKAGPETITGLKFKGGKTKKLKTDTYATIEGTFRYNETDVDDWIYHLDDAVIVKAR